MYLGIWKLSISFKLTNQIDCYIYFTLKLYYFKKKFIIFHKDSSNCQFYAKYMLTMSVIINVFK